MLGMSHSKTEEVIPTQVLGELIQTRKGGVRIPDKRGTDLLSIHPKVLFAQGKEQVNDFEGMPSGSGEDQWLGSWKVRKLGC